MHDSDSGIGIDSGITLFLAGIGIGIKKIKFCWNRNGISALLAGIGIRTGIRLLNFPGIGTVIGIKIYPESCITDIGQIRAYCGSGLYQKFYCILLLPTSGGILQLVYSTGAPPMGPEQENKK